MGCRMFLHHLTPSPRETLQASCSSAHADDGFIRDVLLEGLGLM
jgi:hypothetical protein